MPWIRAQPIELNHWWNLLVYEAARYNVSAYDAASVVASFNPQLVQGVRPRIAIHLPGNSHEVFMGGQHTIAHGGGNAAIFTKSLTSCVGIAVASYDPTNMRLDRVFLGHLSGGYYQGTGGYSSDASWADGFAAMPAGRGANHLYAIVAGSSGLGSWYEGAPTFPPVIVRDICKVYPGFNWRNLRIYVNRSVGAINFGINMTTGFFGQV